MVKIKILGKSFSSTHNGWLESGKEYQVQKHFADYCVLKMKSAVYCEDETVKKIGRPKKEVK